MAEEAKKMRKEDRLEKYSFATLYKGKWGIHPDSEDEGDDRNTKSIRKEKKVRIQSPPAPEPLLEKKKKRTKTTPKIIRPDIFSDDEDNPLVSPQKYKPKKNGLDKKEDINKKSEGYSSSEEDNGKVEYNERGPSSNKDDHENESEDEFDENKLAEALRYDMPEMYEVHTENKKGGRKKGLPLPIRNVKVEPDVKPLITEIKLDIDAIKPEHGEHLER